MKALPYFFTIDKSEKYIELLKKYKAVLSPDYSIYIEMNPVMQMYNTFRNRWVGTYLAEKGIKVVPTVSWGLENTFDFCFNGIEKGSTVAVSTYMVSEHGNHKDQKDFFMKGYNELLKRIEPELIICYNTPFSEMEGNILFVDYGLSSWQHYNDDLDKSAQSFLVKKFGQVTDYPAPANTTVKRAYGYIDFDYSKGMGSANGGEWKPSKEEDKRLLGTPNTIGKYTKANGEVYLQKYNNDGKAIKERHLTNHNQPWAHTNPHDHIITWEQGFPLFAKKIDYDTSLPIPEFKTHIKGKGSYVMKALPDNELQFKSISDFKWSMMCGGEIQFDWKEKSYCISRRNDGKFSFSQANRQDSEIIFESFDSLLNNIVGGNKLREIITYITVTDRTM